MYYYQIFELIAGYLTADFIMGVFHWFKDSYFTPHTPFIGKHLIWGSRLHHIKPRYVIEISDFKLFFDSSIWSLIWVIPMLLIFGLNIYLGTMIIFVFLNDVIHKYSHMTDKERPKWITFLQKSYFLQSHAEHHLHHISPHEDHYCPITPFVNIILEKIKFWRKLENYILRNFQVSPRATIDHYVDDLSYPGGIKFIEKY